MFVLFSLQVLLFLHWDFAKSPSRLFFFHDAKLQHSPAALIRFDEIWKDLKRYDKIICIIHLFLVTFYRNLLVSGEKHRRCERPQTGVYSACAWPKGRTPEQGQRTIISPKGATEYVTCLILTCVYICRPFGAFTVVATLPGVLPFGQAQAENTPVCGLSRLDFVDLWFGAFPRTAIICYTMPWASMAFATFMKPAMLAPLT